MGLSADGLEAGAMLLGSSDGRATGATVTGGDGSDGAALGVRLGTETGKTLGLSVSPRNLHNSGGSELSPHICLSIQSMIPEILVKIVFPGRIE